MSSNVLLDWARPCDAGGNPGTVEAAYVEAAEQKHGSEFTFWARLDGAGGVEVAQVLKIVENVEDEYREVKLANVITRVPTAKPGEFFLNRIKPVEPDEPQALATVKNVRISLT